ncbi:SAM-dependent methyltransferase [Mycoplasma sp. ATU-Cv-508]|uniref:SAM-dependent methyltransferase n=1 Tax=Mycoplasma sp. ATU-Cv-508 TaxID=2048001 RepID=UPI000FDD307C
MLTIKWKIWPRQAIKESDQIDVKLRSRWVSRGAEKLSGVLSTWKIDFQGKNVLDVGASAGGFTQVALEQGAKHVWALDVGTNQLDYLIRQDARVSVLEKKNAKNLDPSWFKEKVDIVTCDLSFISLTKVFGPIRKIWIPAEF